MTARLKEPTQQPSAPARHDAIADLHRDHARELERRVARRARADPQTIEDACSFAWLQLLTHTAVKLSRTPDAVLAWLVLTATREAWRLDAERMRVHLMDVAALDWRPDGGAVAGADEVVAQRARLRLIEQIAERPRRFLWRLALGNSYVEIAAQERVSVCTTNKQLAHARRALRTLDAAQGIAPDATS
jgi:DNA-directed RNA polymerase specialized sigma24 family protein